MIIKIKIYKIKHKPNIEIFVSDYDNFIENKSKWFIKINLKLKKNIEW
jgi:hypothetical protein